MVSYGVNNKVPFSLYHKHPLIFLSAPTRNGKGTMYHRRWHHQISSEILGSHRVCDIRDRRLLIDNGVSTGSCQVTVDTQFPLFTIYSYDDGI